MGAYRHGRTLTFFILGKGYDRVKSVKVETVADAGRGLAVSAVADNPPYFGPRLWRKFVTLHPVDLHVQTVDASGLTCPELKILLDSIDQDLDDPYFSQNVSFAVTRALHAFRDDVKGLLDKCGPPALSAVFAWSRFSPDEVAGAGRFTGPKQTLKHVRVVLPEGFTISNHLCPSQLPIALISGNQIGCSGGALGTGQPFKLNLQTIPSPTAGMGGQLFGGTGGTLQGPFTITGP